MLGNTLNAIVQALKKHESVESIQRFTNTQNILKQYGHKNILSLARQAHLNQMELNDVRTEAQWKKVGVNPNTFSKRLLIYYPQKDDNGNTFLREELAYDISHTDATAQAVTKRETIVKADNHELLYENFKNYVIEAFPEANIGFNKTYTSNAYYPHSKTITLYDNNPPLENINFLIQTLYKETIYGEDIRKHKYLDAGDNLDSAIQKLITNSILNRFSILPEQVDNRLTFNETQELFQNLEIALETISKNIKSFDKKLQIGQFINEKFHSYDELYKFQKEFDDKIKKLTGNTAKKPQPVEYSKREHIDFIELSDDEAKILKDKTKDELLLQNPLPILDSLSLAVGKIEDSRIKFKARVERTASASMFIKGGVWCFKDFGGGDEAKGSIINVVMQTLNCEFKEAVQYCCDTLNVPNYFQIRPDEIKYEKDQLKIKGGWHKIDEHKKPKLTSSELLAEKEEQLAALRDANAEYEKQNSTNSRVTYISKTIPQNLITFLKSRGIKNTQIDNFYYIKGETWKLNDNDIACDIKQKEGVGVLCADEIQLKELYSKVEEKGFFHPETPISQEQTIGADLHFPPYSFTTEKGEEVTMKTISLGAKKNTTFIDYQGDTIAPIESKMDYAAATQELNFKSQKIDVDIANSTSNADMIAKNIATRKYPNTYFLNQFDIPGVKFLVDIHNKAKELGYDIGNFKYIDYKAQEYKQDINDLIKNNITLKSRTKEGSLKDLVKLLDKIATVELDEEKLKELQKVRKMIDSSIQEEAKSEEKSSITTSLKA